MANRDRSTCFIKIVFTTTYLTSTGVRMCRYDVRIIPKRCPDVSGIGVRMRPKYAHRLSRRAGRQEKCRPGASFLDGRKLRFS
jgi:hypothetical protein